MKQIIRNIILCALILSVFPFAAPAQKKGPEQVAIRFTVVDQLGNPVPGAEVSVGEGMGRFMTDADGRVSVNCAVTDVVRVEMDGFKTVNIRAGVLVDSDSVVLVPDVLFADLPLRMSQHRAVI